MCTSCNAPVLPVVAFDIDGTLAQYHEHFLEFAANYLDHQPRPHYDGSVELSDWLGISKEEYRQVKLAYRMGGGKRLMPSFGAVERIVNPLGKFAEVWMTTTRPWQRFDSTDPDTREWLRRHGIKFKGLIYGEHKYQELVDIVGQERIVAVVDDDPDQYDAADLIGVHPILVQRQHNRGIHHRRPVEAAGLFRAQTMITDRIRRWEGTHNGK